jgi:hypothetical protein
MDGPDEPDGTVECLKCDRNFPMKRTPIEGGADRLSVPDHQAPRRRKGRKAVRARVPNRNRGRS